MSQLVPDDEEVQRLVDPRLRTAAEPGPAAARQRREDVDELLVLRGVVARLSGEVGRLGGHLAVVAGRGPGEPRGQPGRDDAGKLMVAVRSLGVVLGHAVRRVEHHVLRLRQRIRIGRRVAVLDQDHQDLRAAQRRRHDVRLGLRAGQDFDAGRGQVEPGVEAGPGDPHAHPALEDVGVGRELQRRVRAVVGNHRQQQVAGAPVEIVGVQEFEPAFDHRRRSPRRHGGQRVAGGRRCRACRRTGGRRCGDRSPSAARRRRAASIRHRAARDGGRRRVAARSSGRWRRCGRRRRPVRRRRRRMSPRRRRRPANRVRRRDGSGRGGRAPPTSRSAQARLQS